MRVAIEGLDGTGKTMLATAIAEKYGFKYVAKPYALLFQQLDLDAEKLRELEWRLYPTHDEVLLSTFYFMGIINATRQETAENVVYDRHFGSNYYWHGNEETYPLHHLMVEYCGKPDVTIVLKASTESRINRIRANNPKDFDLSNSAVYEDKTNKILEFLDREEMPYVIVDTDNKSKEEVVAESFGIIDELMTKKKGKVYQRVQPNNNV